MERCLLAEVAWESVTGENEATVGGFGSLLAMEPPSSSLRVKLGVEDIIQGVSCARVSHGMRFFVLELDRTKAAIRHC